MNDNGSDLFCPTCGATPQFLTEWKFSGLNDSVFNYIANFLECPDCGLAFIANVSDERLKIFYENECSYFDNSHFDISAPENIQKYEYYREIIARAGLSETSITDVGCGRGGFLIWLMNSGWKANCQGVDIDLKSIPATNTITGEEGAAISFQEGRAVSLPFDDGTKSLLTYFHVLEHMRDINKVLKEAFRVLGDSGHIMIEVPDAEKYKDYPIGTAFWLSIREHVNHFSPNAIADALQLNGFDVVSINRKLLPTPEFYYPSLIILARKSGHKRKINLQSNRDIASFIIKSQKDLITQASNINEFSASFLSLTFWGCSSGLFSLLPILNQKTYSICDSSKLKQKCHYGDIPVNDPKIIQKNGALIIAPYLHGDAIEKAAIEQGWTKESIYRLS